MFFICLTAPLLQAELMGKNAFTEITEYLDTFCLFHVRKKCRKAKNKT